MEIQPSSFINALRENREGLKKNIYSLKPKTIGYVDFSPFKYKFLVMRVLPKFLTFPGENKPGLPHWAGLNLVNIGTREETSSENPDSR